MGNYALVAAASVLTTITLILLTLRAPLLSSKTWRMAVTWARLPTYRALPLTGALVALAAASIFQVENTDGGISASAGATLLTAPGTTADGENAPRERAIEKLRDYADGIRSRQQTIAALDSAANGESGQPSLPDVDTMIARLAARLETQPDDVKGWNTLGWAYASTGKFSEAVSAYETALKLDPANTELQAAAAAARTRAGTATVDAKPVPETTADEIRNMPQADQNAAIAAMVERLAARLESSPKDADGWVQLMRSRTVLGQSDLARDALRKALAAFPDDADRRDMLSGAAKEFGLSAY